MGANAQTSVPAFTTGQVLTAQQQTEINTGVPVFATTTTRDAAFGGTGEKVLAEGQLAYIEASDVVQYYNGTAWATLAPATPGALTLVTSSTFSAAASVAVDSCFTSTYQNYRVIFIVTASATATGDTTLQYRTGGATNSTANYTRGLVGISSGSSFDGSYAAGSTSYNLGSTASNEGNYVMALDIYRPQETTLTNAFVTNMLGYGSGTPRYGSLQFTAATAFDGFIVTRSAGTMTGNYRVYGYSNS